METKVISQQTFTEKYGKLPVIGVAITWWSNFRKK